MKKTNYKLLFFYLMTMLMLVGCKSSGQKYKNKNVILDIASNKNEKMLLLRDIKFGDTRIYTIPRMPRFGSRAFDDIEYLCVGDTVYLCLTCEEDYLKQNFFSDGYGNVLEYNRDSIQARKNRYHFQQQMQNFNQIKQENIKEAQY